MAYARALAGKPEQIRQASARAQGLHGVGGDFAWQLMFVRRKVECPRLAFGKPFLVGHGGELGLGFFYTIGVRGLQRQFEQRRRAHQQGQRGRRCTVGDTGQRGIETLDAQSNRLQCNLRTEPCVAARVQIQWRAIQAIAQC
ncbi:hypothetical protein D3C85_903730 [compost metagenome]